ncbi:amino acid adenylation domain-containing protein, partial [Streptomyces sp. NPDC023588]|uniref:amino acid adenylation domain-containing protein n=1 Tax=Streptomyces sp. NPDC023588 TaxID=3154907 RepID=UPI0033D12A59
GREVPAYEIPSVRYADFIAAELASLAQGKDQHFWSGIVERHTPMSLPAGWRAQSGPSESLRLQVDFRDLEGDLRRLARQADVSLKSVLLAAHLKVLGTLTSDADFHTGVVYHGRLEAPGAERVLGMHLNTLPFPATRPSGTWQQLVERVHAQETEIWGHRRYPLPAIQRDSGDSRRLISVMFDFQDFHQIDAAAVDVEAGLGAGVNEFALSVIATGGTLVVKTSTDALSRANADRLTSMYRLVLQAMATDADGDAAATYLPEVEQVPVSRLRPEAIDNVLTLELFSAQAVATPKAVAVISDDERISYQELDERSNRLAHHLRELGAGPGVIVGLHVQRSLAVHTAMLAVWKTGAAYVPVDPALPADRAAYMLTDAGAELVVTDSFLDSAREAIEGQPATALGHTTDPEQLAYVLYTSGSTGRPKGVMISHGALHNLLTSVRDDIGTGRRGAWLASTSISFDISGLELHLPLITGGRVVLASDEQAKDATALLDLIDRHRVTHVQATPSGWRLLLAAGFDNYAVTALTGGEPISVELANELAAKVQRLVNVYGPTETTIWSSYWEVPDTAVDAVSIGGPLANTQLYVLDTNAQPVPAGITGELYIGGTGLAHGYLGRPDLTAEKFVPNPYGPQGSRLYRTGDLARELPDGTIECLGRIDSQVKVRGYRIELGEIEAELRVHPDVKDAVVIARTDDAGDKSLAAYVVTSGAVDVGGLREHLGVNLPDYMVPAAFVEIDAVPLTNSGKVDHRALPAPDQTAFAAGRHIAPRTPAEERLAAIWCEVLELDRVSVESSFFDLGGDSIRVVRLVGTLRAAGFDIGVQDVFEQQTIARLGQVMARQDTGASLIETVAPFELIGDDDRAALPADAVDAYPLSQIQTGMLVEMLSRPGSAIYHNINSFRIPDERPFSPELLGRAVHDVAQRHDILRTSVDMTGYSQPLQLVHATADLPVTVHDWRGLGPRETERRGREFVDRERSEPFELTHAPLLRIAVHLESETAWRLTLSHCHAVTEGWSVNSLLTEVLATYRQLQDGEEVADPAPLAVRYADFIAAELASLDSAETRSFWQDVVDHYAPMTVPSGWAAEDGSAEDRHWARIPFDDIEAGLRRLAVRAKTSLKSVLLAAHVKVLSTLTADAAFHTGVVYHGRLEAPDADRVLGMHLNTLPFPYLNGARTWVELTEHVFAQETRIWSHRRYPLPAIQRDSGSSQRLLTILFDHQDFHQVDTETVDVEANLGDGVNEFALNVIAAGGAITLGSTTDVLSRHNMGRLASMYRLVLEAMAEDSGGDATSTHLPDDERGLLLTDWATAESVRWPGENTVDLISAQAAATPDSPAVIVGEQRLTYREVEEQSNRIAHYLRDSGVGPDTLVGVCLNRDLHLVPTLVGIWKAGAAYLPLDPSVPTERLSYMLNDAKADIVFTTGEHIPALAGIHYGTFLVLDQDQYLIDEQPTTPVESAIDADQLAYVIYTSGSTGRPKGVMIHHHGLANYLQWTVGAYAEHGSTGAPVFSSISFDLGIPDLFTPLITGQPTHMLPMDLDTSTLGPTLVASGPFSFIKLTPGHLDLLSHQLTPEQAHGLAGLVIAAGDNFPTSLAARWQRLAGPGGTRVGTEYGPTEITIGNSGQFLDELPATELIPLGGPIPNSTMYVLTDELHPTPIGVPGEVYIGGEGLARGYLGRPDLTAEKFVPNPYGPEGSRLYRTGDLARWLPDGSLDFLGRIDNQVKIRGYRIELGEIEARLREHSTIEDAIVSVRESGHGNKRLVAYVVTTDGSAPGVDALRGHLAAALPDYMIPTAFVGIDSVPLTGNGKVDHRALPAPELRAAGARELTEPKTPTEQRLAGIWGEVLGLDDLGVEDSFFDVGGDSIRVVRLVGALRAAGFDVAIRDVFENRTIAALGRLLAG